MGMVSICPKTGLNRGAWSPEEDRLLVAYIIRYGHWNWSELPKFAGLSRCGKSCRLRWKNYLQPHIKRGNYSKDEDELIIRMHQKLGNKWSAIAACLPGRTDNEIKNRWHTHLKKATGLTSTTNGVRQEKPRKCESPKKKEHVENSLENFAPATLVFESSIVHPISPHNSTDNSLPFADFDAVINENLVKEASCISQDSSVLTVPESPLNQTFLAEDFYFLEHSSPLFSLPPSVKSFHPRDIFDGYDMDIFSSDALSWMFQ